MNSDNFKNQNENIPMLETINKTVDNIKYALSVI